MRAGYTEESLKRLAERVNRSTNYLSLVIRGHFVVEQALYQAIRRFSHAQIKDLKRVPFALKCEVAAALGVIPKDSLPLFQSFNKIRNRYAHNPFALFRAKDASDLANCLSPVQRQIVQNGERMENISALAKREFLWRCVLAMFSELYSSMRRRIRHDISHDLTMKDVGPLVAEIIEAGHAQKELDEFNEKVEDMTRNTPLF